MIVVDASAAIAVLLRQEGTRALAYRLLSPRANVHAPHLLDLEIAQVLRRYLRIGDLNDRRAQRAMRWYRDLEIFRHAHAPLLGRVWTLRHNLTAYDAVYVALAEALPATLLTQDTRLAAASGHRAAIELV